MSFHYIPFIILS